MKKLTAIVALLLCLAMLVGCGGNKTPTTTAGGNVDTPATDAPATDAPKKDPVKITWSINDQYTGEVPQDNAPIVVAIEEKFNVDIEFWPVAEISNPEQWNTMVGAGELPDIWETPGNTTKWWDQGIARPLTQEFIEKNAPTLSANLKAFGDEAYASAYSGRAILEGDYAGQYKGIPQMSYGLASQPLTAIRQDWLDNLGLDVPTTFEEFEEMVYAFTFDDPDGNGEDDTYGFMSANNQNGEHSSLVYAAYGTTFDGWALEDGKVVRASTTEAWKKAVGTLAKWTKDGVIPSTFLTDSWDVYFGRFANGEVGSFCCCWDRTSPYSSTSPVAMCLANNPDAKVITVGELPADGYEYKAYGYGGDAGWTSMIRYDVDDEKAALILQILDYIVGEAAELSIVGVEGEDFDYAEDGSVIGYTQMTHKVRRGIFCWPQMVSAEVFGLTNPNKAAADAFVQGFNVPAYVSPMKGLSLPKTNENGWAADLGTLVSEYRVDVILGEKDLDATWDEYLESLKAPGADLDLITEEANEVYKAAGRG